MRLLTACLLLLTSVFAQRPALAQIKLSGQVLDARSRQPLAYASVFLASTTLGTTTDSTGRFVLAGIPAGQYQVMVSYVGYQLFTKALDLQQATTLDVDLLPTAAQLEEVVVRPTKNRPADYRRFTAQFLGNSTLSQQCRIENPEDVVVVYDENRRELVALAPRNLRVLNQALGYRITYHSFDFKINYNSSQSTFVAAPIFEELKSTDAKQQRRWEYNRRKAYAGSMPHFLRSVRENRVAEEGFLVRSLLNLPNSEQTQRRVSAAVDSLAEVLQPQVGVLSLVYKQPLSASQLCAAAADPNRVKLLFKEVLQVTYANEQPDPVYVVHVTDARRQFMVESAKARYAAASSITSLGKSMPFAPIMETSELRLLGTEALVQPNGYLTNPRSVKVDGYWGFEKVGEALPLDYVPALLK